MKQNKMYQTLEVALGCGQLKYGEHMCSTFRNSVNIFMLS